MLPEQQPRVGEVVAFSGAPLAPLVRVSPSAPAPGGLPASALPQVPAGFPAEPGLGCVESLCCMFPILLITALFFLVLCDFVFF